MWQVMGSNPSTAKVSRCTGFSSRRYPPFPHPNCYKKTLQNELNDCKLDSHPMSSKVIILSASTTCICAALGPNLTITAGQADINVIIYVE